MRSATNDDVSIRLISNHDHEDKSPADKTIEKVVSDSDSVSANGDRGLNLNLTGDENSPIGNENSLEKRVSQCKNKLGLLGGSGIQPVRETNQDLLESMSDKAEDEDVD